LVRCARKPLETLCAPRPPLPAALNDRGHAESFIARDATMSAAAVISALSRDVL